MCEVEVEVGGEVRVATMTSHLVPRRCEVDQTEEITSSKADRLTSTTASKSRSRCAGDKKLSPLVVPAMVKSAEESANQPSVVSSPAVFKECFDQSSVFQPASAESVVLCSNLKPADASIPDGLNESFFLTLPGYYHWSTPTLVPAVRCVLSPGRRVGRCPDTYPPYLATQLPYLTTYTT
uniref:Homeodomain protein Msx n=1 Tax=Ditylenchus dipsaci TaxID=166011 RepID=A0A915DG39_9BILA